MMLLIIIEILLIFLCAMIIICLHLWKVIKELKLTSSCGFIREDPKVRAPKKLPKVIIVAVNLDGTVASVILPDQCAMDDIAVDATEKDLELASKKLKKVQLFDEYEYKKTKPANRYENLLADPRYQRHQPETLAVYPVHLHVESNDHAVLEDWKKEVADQETEEGHTSRRGIAPLMITANIRQCLLDGKQENWVFAKAMRRFRNLADLDSVTQITNLFDGMLNSSQNTFGGFLARLALLLVLLMKKADLRVRPEAHHTVINELIQDLKSEEMRVKYGFKMCDLIIRMIQAGYPEHPILITMFHKLLDAADEEQRQIMYPSPNPSETHPYDSSRRMNSIKPQQAEGDQKKSGQTNNSAAAKSPCNTRKSRLQLIMRLQTTSNDRNHFYKHESNRRQSFDHLNWHFGHEFARNLAEQGFIYSGGSTVTCHFCNVQLSFSRQETERDISMRHRAETKDCPFMRGENVGNINNFIGRVCADLIKQDENNSEGSEIILRCQVCCINNVSCVFLPCMHAVVCSSCGREAAECPRCGEAIADRLGITMEGFKN